MSLMDLHHFPLWEKEVHDVLQECFQDMQSIFAFYCKSIGGSDSAEAAVEMNMSEFKARDRVPQSSKRGRILPAVMSQLLFSLPKVLTGACATSASLALLNASPCAIAAARLSISAISASCSSNGG